jgi:negative regulator of sigma E activity
MSLLSPPPVQRGGAQPPDDIDQLLRTFYKTQLPEPWPALAAPRRTVAPVAGRSARGWPLMRSRMAVAASVALLAIGSLLLAGALQGRANRAPAPVLRFEPSAKRPSFDGTAAPLPDKLKINESLIQEPNGTTIHVDVIDWPTTRP